MRARDDADTVQLSKIRIKERVRRQLERAASSNDVTLNAEIANRLERSFERERTLSETAEAALNAKLGGPHNAAAFLILAAIPRSEGVEDTWLTNRGAFETVREKIDLFLKGIAPPTDADLAEHMRAALHAISRVNDPELSPEERLQNLGVAERVVSFATQRGIGAADRQELRRLLDAAQETISSPGLKS